MVIEVTFDLESISNLVAAKLKGTEVGTTPEPIPGPSQDASTLQDASALPG